MRTIFYIACLFLVACNAGPDESVLGKEDTDSASIVPNHLAVKTDKELTDAKGIIGIFYVPEMLTVVKMDSAPVKKVPMAMAKGFEIIQEDIKLIKAERNGSMGAIYWNNDTTNFIFECVVPIERMPKIQPKKTQVVVLEEAKMIIYNHYGSYLHLNDAYDEIRQFCADNKLEQSGPLREFYITDATVVKDSSQWLTRIMLPVK